MSIPVLDHGEHAEPDPRLTVPEVATLDDLAFAGAALARLRASGGCCGKSRSGSADGVVEVKHRWDEVLATVDLDREVVGLMPTPQPFNFVGAWVNFELTKNLSEIHMLIVRHSNADQGRAPGDRSQT